MRPLAEELVGAANEVEVRWSLNDAQAMLALHAHLLSDRWHEIPL